MEKNNVKHIFQAVYFIVKIKMNNSAKLSQAKRYNYYIIQR